MPDHIYNLVLFCPDRKREKPTHLQLLTETKDIPSQFFIPDSFPAYDQGNLGSCTANALCAGCSGFRLLLINL